MKSITVLILAVGIPFFVHGTEEPAAASIAAIDQLARIKRDHQEAEAVYQTAVRALANKPEAKQEAQDAWTRFDDRQAELFLTAVDLAEENPNSDAGFQALEWMLNTVRVYYLAAGPRGLELMKQHYAKDPRIGAVIAALAYYLPPDDEPSHRPALDLLTTVAESNPDRTARAQAALGLAWVAKRKFEHAEAGANPTADVLAGEAASALESVIRDYGDCQNLRSRGIRPAAATVGQEAEPDLRELTHLRIGQRGPEIEGEDLSGVPFKLSDYHGSVVLLVFWASWCGPCMADIPHEKELVQRFLGRPFVLIGVNGDPSRDHALWEGGGKHQIPWRSFWNGPRGPGGPIAQDWNVRGWPRTFLLDEQGVIRHKNLRGKALDAPLLKMVQAAEIKFWSDK
jgi:thiol-disulfide isomerase/thioredoxin